MTKKQLMVAWVILIALIPVLVFAGDTKVLFSPNGGCQKAIVDEISKATKTIDIAMY